MRHAVLHYHKIRLTFMSYIFTQSHEVAKSGCDETDYKYLHLSSTMTNLWFLSLLFTLIILCVIRSISNTKSPA